MNNSGSHPTMTFICGQDSTCDGGVVTRLHDVVGVPLKDLGADPALLPVPQLDEHVIGGRQNVRQRGVDSNAPAQTHSNTYHDLCRGQCARKAIREKLDGMQPKQLYCYCKDFHKCRLA